MELTRKKNSLETRNILELKLKFPFQFEREKFEYLYVTLSLFPLYSFQEFQFSLLELNRKLYVARSLDLCCPYLENFFIQYTVETATWRIRMIPWLSGKFVIWIKWEKFFHSLRIVVQLSSQVNFTSVIRKSFTYWVGTMKSIFSQIFM